MSEIQLRLNGVMREKDKEQSGLFIQALISVFETLTMFKMVQHIWVSM